MYYFCPEKVWKWLNSICCSGLMSLEINVVSEFSWLSSFRNGSGERSSIGSFFHCFEIFKLIHTKTIGVTVYFMVRIVTRKFIKTQPNGLTNQSTVLISRLNCVSYENKNHGGHVLFSSLCVEN